MDNKFFARMRKTVSAVLIAALAVSCTAGCGRKVKNAEGVIATFDKTDVSADLAQFMIRYEQYIFETQSWDYLSQLYGENVNLWEIDVTGEGSSFWETMKNQRMEDLKKLLLAEKHAEDTGVTEDDYKDRQKDIKDTARKFISSLDRDTAKALCATEDTVSEYLKLMTIQSVVEDKIAETADRKVSDEEARQVSVSWASFPKEGNYTVSSGTDETETEPDTENTSESVSETEPDTENVIGDETEAETGAENDTAGEEAEAFLKSIPDADGFDTTFHEFTEKYAESPVMEDEYTFGADDTYPDSAVVSAAMEAEEDNTLLDSVVEGQDAYYVVLVTDAFDDDATAQKKEEIVSERENTAISEKYAEWEKESDWEVKSDVLSEIKADRRFVAPEEIETDISSSETETEAESENGPIVSYAETESETDVESVAETPGIDDETEADMTEGGK